MSEQISRRSAAARKWPGSTYVASYAWILDQATSLGQVADAVRGVSDELSCAHAAGWYLDGSIHGGLLRAQRASRRQRALLPAKPQIDERAQVPASPLSVRLRVINDPPAQGSDVLSRVDAPSATWIRFVEGQLVAADGKIVDNSTRAIIEKQLGPAEAGEKWWAIAPARTGPGFDLVAEGSELRSHRVKDGHLQRTVETLGFVHLADQARSLAQASAIYGRLADAAENMMAAGGRLAWIDGGFVVVEYTA